ncbi:hypothetical protein AcV5_008669 [Taiwanofungus camphoratus]|nr:hypothetical protein AcV5_008669 [Antrodia cinnamomea]KAI0956210.1 hypothetical protein AcV7_006665 [Antrodia cinnamomea]
MLPHSSTNDPLTEYHNGHISPSNSSEQRYSDRLRTISFPVMTRTTSVASTRSNVSCSSTVALVSHPEPERGKRRLSERILSWNWRSEKTQDAEMKEMGVLHPSESDHDGIRMKKQLKAWHGWQLILFDSWLNVLIFFIPTSWILKLATTNSDTLIFTSCVLAMIPLVRLHDLAIGVLSRRIGGSKTGLLNASMSNIVELVVAIIALRKCELRVVQSSLIGSMLSKLLLILGMCFFAGGIRFSEQDFDATATQIHSSLLSISVGAVCLPAAFHFALTYNTEDAMEAGTTLDQQKQDLLRMSHGVSIVLLFIYVSYLLFQLVSHTHLYKDSTKASDKLPVAASVRSVGERVRRKSSSLRQFRSHSKSGSMRSARSTQSKQSLTVTLPDRADRERNKDSPLEEVPETSFDDLERGRSPYGHNGHNSNSNASSGATRERRALLVSPFGTTSQVTLSMNEFGVPAPKQHPTVRLVRDGERSGDGGTDRGSAQRSDYSTRSSDKYRRRHGSSSSGSETDSPVSEVLSAYLNERGEVVQLGVDEDVKDKRRRRDIDVDVMEVHEEQRSDQEQRRASPTPEAPKPEELEMSWTMTIMLLTIVTVLVTINSEWLVDSMDSISPTLSKEWIGLILLPIVSSIAECVTAVSVSVQDQLTLSISVAVGSTIVSAFFPFLACTNSAHPSVKCISKRHFL